MKKLINVFLLLFTISFYGQNDTISVVRHTDNDLIIPKNLKVVYRGIPNNLLIEVPNCKSFTASANGLILISKNNYNLNPGSGVEVVITIDIVLKNNTKITEKHKFRIKNISNVFCFINNIKDFGLLKMNKNQLKGAIISAKLLDENLNFKFKVYIFDIKLPDGKSYEVKGNKINEETFNKLRISKGSKIIICNIQLSIIDNESSVNFCKTNIIEIQIN
jgi:hypothetical protein